VEIFETSQARLWQYNVRRFRGVRIATHRGVSSRRLSSFCSSICTISRTFPHRKTVRRADAPKIVLTHVRVIDGTGASAVDDQNVVIEGGKISAIEKGADGRCISRRNLFSTFADTR